MIKIEHLKMQFEQVVILKDISIEIGDGEVVAIIGPSGTGKSTFLRCLNFLVKPTEGKITIDGFTVDAKTASKKDIHELRQKQLWFFKIIIYLKIKLLSRILWNL